MRHFFLTISLLFLLSFATIHAQDKNLQVVASTTIIADIAQNVGGDFLTITALIPAETDVHAFEPLPSDLRMLESADLILLNGAGLEQYLADLLANIEPDKIATVSNGIKVLGFDSVEEDYIGILGEDVTCNAADPSQNGNENAHGECDPHFWFDPMNVVQMVENIANAFSQLDPDHADSYQSNARSYIEELKVLDNNIRETLSVIPPEKRILVTNHEFLAYFAHAYDFQIIATVIPGVTTLAEASPRDLAALIAQIEQDKIAAIFTEMTETTPVAQLVAEEAKNKVQIVALYTASLSAEDGEAATYIDLMRFNTKAILDALSSV